MKKLLLITFLSSIIFTYGQNKEGKFAIEKGTWNYEGQFSLNFIDAAPRGIQVGYTFKDNWVIGLGLEDINTAISPKQPTFVEQGGSAYAFVKKYFPIGKKLAFSIQGNIGYTRLNRGLKFGDALDRTDNINQYSLNLRPELTYFLSKNVAVKMGFGSIDYGFRNFDTNNSNTSYFDFNTLDPAHYTFGIILNF